MRSWKLVALFFVGICCGATVQARADGESELTTCSRLGDRKEDKAAIDHCTRAIESGELSNKALAIAYTDRSMVYRRLRQFDDAVADCSKAIELKDDYVDAQIACGSAYGSTGDFKSSIRYFDRALALEPDNARAHNNRGDALLQSGDYASALQEFESAIGIKPGYELAMVNRGAALYSLGRFKEAAAAAADALKTAPDNAYALLLLTLARRRAGIDMPPAEVMAAAGKIDRESWPWPIVAYFGGKSIALSEAVQFAKDNPADADCEASFYYGDMAIILGKAEEGRGLLQHSFNACPKTFAERAIAQAELTRR